MPRLSRIGAVLLVAVAACGSEPPLPAAEYFPAVEAELARLDQATRDLTDRYAGELEAELDALLAAADPDAAGAAERLLGEAAVIARTKMQAIIEAHSSQVEVFAARVGELVPPEAVAGGHDELVAAFTGWAASGESTVAELGAAGDLAALAEALTASPFADAQFRVDKACQALTANAAAVAVSLTCPGTQLDALRATAAGGAPATTTPVTTTPVTTSPATTTPVTTTPPAAGACPAVIAAELTQTGPGVFTVSTTVRSIDIVDEGWADAWEVRDLAGTVLGTRILAHPHANEQPFTRSLSSVEIPGEIGEVEIAARDSERGYCGETLIVEVPHQ